jgi:hypothetical protein
MFVPDLHEMAAQRFPLIARTRPACRSLETRVAQVRDLANLADLRTGDSLVRGAEAHNMAALIMSDCGMPNQARALCWQQFDVLFTSRSLNAATAKLVLQPLVNLGRLHIRDGDGNSALQLFKELFEAVRSESDAFIDDRSISFSELVSGDGAHREVVQWLWSILLSDGTRALARAGRWAEALQHVQQHKGIGRRPLDGRQVAILAHATAGKHDNTCNMIAETLTPTPWEAAVAACLRVLCLNLANRLAEVESANMVARYLGLEHVHGHAVFQAHLGLCVLGLTADGPQSRQIAATVVRDSLDAADAYAARDALSNRTCRMHITDNESRALIKLVSSSGLGRGTMPADLSGSVTDSLRASEAAMADALRSPN